MLQKINKIFAFILTGLLAAGFAGLFESCQDDYLAELTGSDDDNIMVSASVVQSINTRNAYIESGVIDKENKYYLYYPRKSSSSYVNHAMVEFGDVEGPTTGFAYFFDADGKQKDLKWKHVYNEGTTSQTFHMHNIDSTLYTIYADGHWQHLRFNVKNVVNPYQSSPLDEVNGTNDLLYGVAKGSRSSGKLNFELNHVMSLLKVNIEVFTAKDGFKMDLSNAEVYITNVSTELGVLDMRDPFLFEYNNSTSTTANSGGYNHYPGYYRNIQDVQLVATDPSKPDDLMNWASKHEGDVSEDYEGHFSKEVYESHRWVMPPQSMPTNSTTPMAHLIVKVPYSDATGSPGSQEYKIYEGQVPPVMFRLDENGNQFASPEVFAFKPGHQINITASINSPETELTFAPVTIEAWTSKGSFTVTTKQAGIYNSTDFYNASRLYREGIFEQLERFGSVDEDLCSLQIWGNITLDYKQILESMKPGGDVSDPAQPFEFCFNGYTVTVTKEDGSQEVLEGAVGQERLYNIVTGGNTSTYKGVTKSQDFLDLLELCNSETLIKEDLKKYGYFNNMDNTYTVDIRENITLDIVDVFKKMPRKILGYNVVFVEADNTVVTINLKPNLTIEFRGTDFYDRLAQVVKVHPTPGGFYDNDSFLFMIECYNNYANSYPDLLLNYGTVNASKWTFNHKSGQYNTATGGYNLYIDDGDMAFASMIPGGPNNNPEYSFGYTGSNADLIFTGEYISVTGGNRGTGTWYNITSGQSKTTSFATTASYYNSKSSQNLFNNCGYFKDAMWHFPLSPSYTSEDFSVIFGKMQPDYENKKWDYEITW